MATPCTMSYGAVNGKGKSNRKGHKSAQFVLISNYQLVTALQYSSNVFTTIDYKLHTGCCMYHLLNIWTVYLESLFPCLVLFCEASKYQGCSLVVI